MAVGRAHGEAPGSIHGAHGCKNFGGEPKFRDLQSLVRAHIVGNAETRRALVTTCLLTAGWVGGTQAREPGLPLLGCDTIVTIHVVISRTYRT